MKRDLQADLTWINDPDVCISPKVREICNHAIRRAMEAEEENVSLREQLEQAQAEAGVMWEALLNINELGNCDKCGQTYILHDIADVKHKALSITAGREYAEKYRRMEEALRKIANPYDDLIGYIGSDAKYLIKIAKKALEGGKRDE